MSGANGNVGHIREQIGRIEAKLDAQAERATERQQDSAEQRERIWVELRSVKHDARGEATVVSLRLEKLERAATDLQGQFGRMKDELGLVKAPVDELISFNRRLSAIGVVLISVGSVLFAARDAVWSGLVIVLRTILK